MSLSTADITKKLNEFLSTAYLSLHEEYVFFTLAMAFSCIIFPIVIVRIWNKYEQNRLTKKGEPIKAYLFKPTSALGLHYTVLITVIGLAVRELICSMKLTENTLVYDNEVICISVLLLIFAAVSCVNLCKFHSSGLIMTGMFFIFFAVFKQYQWLLQANKITKMYSGYKLVVRYGSYVRTEYLVIQSMAIWILAVIAIIFLVLYYYKRRFLFVPDKLDLPTCHWCGNLISKGNNFCTCCGNEVLINPIKQTVLPLDNERRCKRCGKPTHNSVCTNCNAPEYLKKLIQDIPKKKKNSAIKGTLFIFFFCVPLVLPLVKDNVGAMETKANTVHNEYVSNYWNEFGNNPKNAYNEEWVAGFDSAIEALYLIDSRWCYVKPRVVRRSDLMYYSAYAEATFMQMEILENHKRLVHDMASKNIDENTAKLQYKELTNQLDQTVRYQRTATSYRNDGEQRLLVLLGYYSVDALRYYLAHVNIVIVSKIIIVLCFFMLIYILNSFSRTTETGLERFSRNMSMKTEKYIKKYHTIYSNEVDGSILQHVVTAGRECRNSFIRSFCELEMLLVKLFCMIGLALSLFSPRNFIRCLRWISSGLYSKRSSENISHNIKKFKRQELFTSIFAGIIAVIIFGSFVLKEIYEVNNRDSGEEIVYLADASNAAIAYAEDISAVLIQMTNEKSMTNEEKEYLYKLIDLQIEADQTILDYDMTEFEDYMELHGGLCSLCTDDIKALERIRNSIDNGLVPSQELVKNYVSLRGLHYSWVLEQLVQEYMSHGLESAYDL